MTVCDRERGSKIIKNSVTYFKDGPLDRKSCMGHCLCMGFRIVEIFLTSGDL